MTLQGLSTASSAPADSSVGTDEEIKAATIIQSAFRGWKGKQVVLSLTDPKVGSKDRCPICWRDFVNAPLEKRIKTSCRHIFHEACIQEWVNVRSLCPLCITPNPLEAPKLRQIADAAVAVVGADAAVATAAVAAGAIAPDAALVVVAAVVVFIANFWG